MTAPVLKIFKVMGLSVVTSTNVERTLTIAVSRHSAQMQLDPLAARVCQAFMGMDGHVKMLTSAKRRLIIAV